MSTTTPGMSTTASSAGLSWASLSEGMNETPYLAKMFLCLMASVALADSNDRMAALGFGALTFLFFLELLAYDLKGHRQKRD